MPHRIEILAKVQEQITKNPIAFLASVFFLFTSFLFYRLIDNNEDATLYWKTLYIQERTEKDKLKDELLMKAGIIERQKVVISEADSLLRDNTEKEAKIIIEKDE